MIKKLTGLLLFTVGIAVIIIVILQRDNFRSMVGWDHFSLRHRLEKTAAGRSESPARTVNNTQKETDSLALSAADSCARIDPHGSIH